MAANQHSKRSPLYRKQQDRPTGATGLSWRRPQAAQICLMLFLWMPNGLFGWTSTSYFPRTSSSGRRRRKHLLPVILQPTATATASATFRYEKLFQLQAKQNQAGEEEEAEAEGDNNKPKIISSSSEKQRQGEGTGNGNNNRSQQQQSKQERSISSLLPPPLDPPPPPRKKQQQINNNGSRNSRHRAKTKMHPQKKFLHHGSSNHANGGHGSSGGKRSPGPKGKARRPPARQRGGKFNSQQQSSPTARSNNKDRSSSFSSMLPPPLKSPNEYGNDDDDDAYEQEDDDSYSNRIDYDPASSANSAASSGGVSSWEQFLGTTPRPQGRSGGESSSSSSNNQKEDELLSQKTPSMAKLPSIQDLFPPDLSLSSSSSARNGDRSQQRRGGSSRSGRTSSRDESSDINSMSQEEKQSSSSSSTSASSQQSQQQLEGVLPVSDLFYRSSQSMDSSSEQQESSSPPSRPPRSSSLSPDDEELPFSAEQTDQLAVDHNKVKVRTNQALETLVPKPSNINSNSNNSSNNNKNQRGAGGGSQQQQPRRKMVRRGMEMLVGGVPINADPPKRSIELLFHHNKPQSNNDWHSAIAINTPNFGPFLCDHQATTQTQQKQKEQQHQQNPSSLSKVELGLFCEYFVHYTMKWDVCPKEFRTIVQEYYEQAEDMVQSNASLQQQQQQQQQQQKSSDHEEEAATAVVIAREEEATTSKKQPTKLKLPSANRKPPTKARKKAENIRKMMEDTQSIRDFIMEVEDDDPELMNDPTADIQKMIDTVESMKGFIKQLTETTKTSLKIDVSDLEDDDDDNKNKGGGLSSSSPRGFGRSNTGGGFGRSPGKQHKSKKKPTMKDRDAQVIKDNLRKMKQNVKDMEEEIASLIKNSKKKDGSEDFLVGDDIGEFGGEKITINKRRGGGGKGFSKNKKKEEEYYGLVGVVEIGFDLTFSKEELETEGQEDGKRGTILREIFEKGMHTCLKKEIVGLPEPVAGGSSTMVIDNNTVEGKKTTMILDRVVLKDLQLTELTDEGTTETRITFEITVIPISIDVEKAKQELARICNKIDESGEMVLAMAAVVKEEERWSQEFRDRVYEDFLFEEDEEDKTVYEEDEQEGESAADEETKEEETDQREEGEDSASPLENIVNATTNPQPKDTSSQRRTSPSSTKSPSKDTVKAAESTSNVDEGPAERDNRFLRGGPDGVFWDYSEANAHNAPFQGKLGPKLLEVMEERSKDHPPKVIAVGDVHGCIDELQDLLRQCDYYPGDLIVFLGDLVSKGPDSISVVQMSREIGAIGVRGNHDFEVIRWHQAIKSGVDPPVVGSEHYHVASCLSKADVKWLYSLPWYITSKELGALFVHAGFVSGIRLAKQNPRLMMNMRSILPDGTVTSKFFNNWPWARLWDGPQTVFFGHDADRGLQQYEHAIGLDTGCVYGGRLTACILPEKRLVSVSARREYFKYRRKHYD